MDEPQTSSGSGFGGPDDPLLAGMTEPQRAAVLHTEGALLLLAGPGSGKTRVITRRIAHLVRMGVPPWQILAVTFTNKAAGEMRERVHTLLEGDERSTRGLTVTTFHALCARLLRRYAGELNIPGFDGTFSIYDSADQATLVKKQIADLGLSTSNFPPRSVLWHISQAKNKLMDAAAFEKHASDFQSRTVAKVFRAYERALRAANAADFDDLLMLTVRVLERSADARAEVRARWQYVMVDEYQDTNHAQFSLARLIAERSPEEKALGARANICVVGDPDQSIYGWRGADLNNILEFEEVWPDARVITLGENFRSRAPILEAADTLIKRNRKRKHKALFTSRKGGVAPEAILVGDEHHEARVVLDWLRARAEEGVPWKEMAVFYRTNALSRVMEDALRAGAVPYVIARGTAFYDREEVKDTLAYLRVLANPADGVSLARIVNKPTRGVGATSLQRVEAHAADNGISLLDAMRQSSRIDGVSPRAAAAIDKFLAMLDRWTGAGSFMGEQVGGSLAELVERVVKESGLEKLHGAGDGEQGEERLANLAEVVSSAAEFEKEYEAESDAAADAPTEDGAPPPTPPLLALLRGYLEAASLVADADAIDPANGAVTLMTLHAAKGLEFDAVAMIGLEDGLLPHSRSRENEAELEEERRLCFVGVTRARERLLLTSARMRTLRGIPERTIKSAFLEELGEGLQVSDQAGGFETYDDEGDAGGAPGWGRSFSTTTPSRGRAPTPRGPTPVGSGGGSYNGIEAGSAVRHPQFGRGRVVAIDGRGPDARARVEFVGVGTKTLVLKYARLEKL